MPPLLTIDSIWRILHHPLPLPPFVLSLLIYHYSHSLPHSHPFPRWLTLLTTLLLLKPLSNFLSRLTLNHGFSSDPPNWEKDVVLITGGTNGIGREVVEILRRKGAGVAVLDLTVPVVGEEGGGNVRWYWCDVSEPGEVEKVAKEIRADLGNPTILINNAGIARGKTILDTTLEEFLLSYKVNVGGAVNVLREFLPHIIAINHGHIITTASSAAYLSIPQLSEYSSSKSALLTLHEVLSQELVSRYNAPKVRTSVVCPLKVSTQMGDAMRDQDTQFLVPTLDPKSLAEEMVKVLESGLSAHLVTPLFAQLILPGLRGMPDWFRWVVHKVGRTDLIITDKGNEEQRKVYKVVEELDGRKGL